MSLDKKLKEIHLTPEDNYGEYETLSTTDVEAIKQVFRNELPEEAKRVWLENERYKLIYGEIPEKHGAVDVLTAYKTYKDNDDFQQNFGRYVEALKTKLGADHE